MKKYMVNYLIVIIIGRTMMTGGAVQGGVKEIVPFFECIATTLCLSSPATIMFQCSLNQ